MDAGSAPERIGPGHLPDQSPVGGSSWCPQFIPQPVAPASPTPVASPILPGAGQPVSKRQLHLYNASPDLEKKIRELIQQGY